MRVALACLLIVCSWTQAQSAVIFSVRQATPGDITLGSTAVFNVSISSNAGTINNLDGIDFVIDAADPTLSGVSAGGRLVAGENKLFLPLEGNFALQFPGTFNVFGGNSSTPLTIGAGETLVATVTLSTVGATIGNYTLGVSDVNAIDNVGTIPNGGPARVAYSIVAVPEPSTMLLLFGGVCVVGARRFLKKRKVV